MSILLHLQDLPGSGVSVFTALYETKSIVFHLGTAYIHGLIHATGNFVIIMDADLSHHVSVGTN
jgi:hypothetical protein